MIFEWDEAKNVRNVLKHKLDFVAVNEFDWDGSVKVDRTRSKDGERRFAAIGLYAEKLHTIIFVYRGDGLRIVSMRRANQTEEKIYENIQVVQEKKTDTRH